MQKYIVTVANLLTNDVSVKCCSSETEAQRVLSEETLSLKNVFQTLFKTELDLVSYQYEDWCQLYIPAKYWWSSRKCVAITKIQKIFIDD